MAEVVVGCLVIVFVEGGNSDVVIIVVLSVNVVGVVDVGCDVVGLWVL